MRLSVLQILSAQCLLGLPHRPLRSISGSGAFRPVIEIDARMRRLHILWDSDLLRRDWCASLRRATLVNRSVINGGRIPGTVHGIILLGWHEFRLPAHWVHDPISRPNARDISNRSTRCVCDRLISGGSLALPADFLVE